MSVVIRHKSPSNPFARPDEAQPAVNGSHTETEAPERNEQLCEAPEGRMQPEAPDAGEGRGGHVESEFTHGRSQS